MLDLSLYYRQDPAIDVSRRGDPKYVGRVISSMVRNGQLSLNSTHRKQSLPQWDLTTWSLSNVIEKK